MMQGRSGNIGKVSLSANENMVQKNLKFTRQIFRGIFYNFEIYKKTIEIIFILEF